MLAGEETPFFEVHSKLLVPKVHFFKYFTNSNANEAHI